jgi:hypothetical protein
MNSFKQNISVLSTKILQISGDSSTKSVKTFNSTTDWGVPVGGYYSITYLSSDHNKGLTPLFLVDELVSTTYNVIMPDSIVTNSNGDIIISVIDSPNGRFSGRIIVV